MAVTIRALPRISINLLFGDFSGTSFNAKFLWFPVEAWALLEVADTLLGTLATPGPRLCPYNGQGVGVGSHLGKVGTVPRMENTAPTLPHIA